MILPPRRDRRLLAATLAGALGAPIAAAALVSARTDALAADLGTAGGVAARIATVDADLTGTVRLSDVALGPLLAADSIEASVALASLLDGALRADEIRVAGPRVAIAIDADGDSDLARLAHRVLRPGGPGAGRGAGRLRRIVVSAGSLTARIAGLGELSADGVELVPDAGGVRVITRAVRIAGQAGGLGVELGFARAAAELTLPHLRFGRVLAVAGTGVVVSGPGGRAGRTELRDVAVGRLAGDGALELRASVDDAGIPRPLAIDVRPRGQLAISGDHLPLAPLGSLAPRGVVLDQAHASGAITVRRDGARVTLDADATLDGLAIDHRVIAAVPVPLAGAVHAQLAITPEAIAISRARLEVGAAKLTASGWLRRGQPASGQLDLALAPVACGDLLASLPGELRGPLDGMVLSGALGGHLRLAVDLAAPAGDGVELSASISDACRSEAEPPAADVARLAGVVDQTFADGSHARLGRGEPGWALLAQLPAHVPGAFISAEDGRFYDHAGFDLLQIARSLEIDLREHRLARGGSTISQQLVKNAFLSQRRSFDRKLQEAILTWRLEARLDKAQILERYLNIIELGPRTFGLTAAARYWFDAAPRDLSIRQAAFLAALTSEPSSMSRRVRRAGALDADSAARVDVVLRAMRRDGLIDGAQLDAARTAPLKLSAAALKPER
jgi:hypothetical protein